MHGSIAELGPVPKRDDVLHATGSNRADQFEGPVQGPETNQNSVTLLMRDGSRMTVVLTDLLAQVPELANCLAPIERRPDTVTLVLNDQSCLMLSSHDIVGLRLPKSPSAALALPQAYGDATSVETDVEIHQLGNQRVIRIRNFLPKDEITNLYRTVLARQADFKPSAVLSNDPEYRKSAVLYKFPYYQSLFKTMVIATMPRICSALLISAFPLDGFECQLTATYDTGYFKPHTDNAAQLAHRKLSYVYYFHKLPKSFTGGDIRFFDYNPFAIEENPERHILDISPLHNSIVFFDSSCYHEVRETTCLQPSFENARFTVNGWLGQPKAP